MRHAAAAFDFYSMSGPTHRRRGMDFMSQIGPFAKLSILAAALHLGQSINRRFFWLSECSGNVEVSLGFHGSWFWFEGRGF